jgi:hypothetical protein
LEVVGQGWQQVGELGLAFVLSAAIGEGSATGLVAAVNEVDGVVEVGTEDVEDY